MWKQGRPIITVELKNKQDSDAEKSVDAEIFWVRCIKTTPFGLLLIFACVVYSGGWLAGVDFIKTIISALDEFGKFLFSFALQFPDELGITDWLWTRGIYAVIAVFAAIVAGYAFTAKEKKKLLGIIGSIVSFVSAVFTFA